MEEKDQTIGFRVTPAERQTLNEQASRAGLSVTEYIRSKVLAIQDNIKNNQLEDLVKHAIYQINQTHTALYSIAEAEGKARRFLTTNELREVYDRVRAEALQYTVTFPEHFAVVQAEITAKREKKDT